MMVFQKAIPRRTFLKGVGATVALPLLDAMVPAFAATADPAAPAGLRMGFVYVPNGIVMDKWTPSKEGVGFEMTPILEALTPFRDRLLVLSGLDSRQANGWPGEGGAYHSRASAAYLTGVHPKPTSGLDVHVGPSVDQIAAQKFSKQTQVASLELALDPVLAAGTCEGGTCAYTETLCWRTATTPMPMEDKPRVVFERLFGDSDTTDRAARLALIRENRTILDSVMQKVASLQARLGPRDRAKLTEYLDAVRDVERRIQLAEEQSARELPTLERPAGGHPASFEEYAKLMFDLQLLAYQTDLTRVITFAFAHERSPRAYRELGVPDSHHPLSHHRNDPTSIAKLIKVNSFHVRLFAHYLEKLRTTPDGDGSLLDHMVIVYGSGMSDGNLHTNENLPILLVGGGAGKIKGGRHIRYPVGTPLTNLYLTLLDMAGVAVDQLGDSTGKLELLSIA